MIHRLALSILAAAGLFVAVPAQGGELESPPVKKVKVLAQRFRFNPSKIEVAAGTRLEVSLRSKDTFHGFAVEDTEIDVVVPARGQGEVTVVFEALEPGQYPFKCSKVCGAGHAQMRGMIVVKPSSPEPDGERE